MSKVKVQPELIKWARVRAALDEQEVAEKVPVDLERYLGWEQGDKQPTFNQLLKLSHVLHVPFGYLFLENPPEEELPLPDFRTKEDMPPRSISVDLRETIYDIQRKHDWYKQFRIDNGIVPSFSSQKIQADGSVRDIAKSISDFFDIGLKFRTSFSYQDEYLNGFSSKLETAGVWIVKSSYVRSNNRRPLDVDEFRGFAISDEILPTIFVNSADAKGAQLFTLAHELVHIWIGESGISNPSLNPESSMTDSRLEKLCNAIAAEILVPEEELRDLSGKVVDIFSTVNNLRRHFHVSPIVIARRLLDCGLVSRNEFFVFYASEKERWKQAKDKLKGNDGGPSPYKTVPSRYGKVFTKCIVNSAVSGETLLQSASRLLGCSVPTMMQLASRL
ncbi:XRE family transcriptional regulator [Gallaecimonas kandeliae]|uniref:helix-turn-helix domain-containing protein n=1 Tax=Gallaecimonas kandeliae TaxID=3029055 RepID=UPI002647B685|nr:XRE family transcriptional regulator [Gallaecimonas kandeliae]WKE66217.1 XRE family transcriptional regulator [Gallaecimonas kandeliae]